MFPSCNPKLFAVGHIHYPVNPSSDHFRTDVVVPSSDHCCTETVLLSSGTYPNPNRQIKKLYVKKKHC